jgi:hypothetical protein
MESSHDNPALLHAVLHVSCDAPAPKSTHRCLLQSMLPVWTWQCRLNLSAQKLSQVSNSHTCLRCSWCSCWLPPPRTCRRRRWCSRKLPPPRTCRHSEQVPLAEAPTTAENLPAVQLVQVREIVLFIGTRFSNLYTSVHTPA